MAATRPGAHDLPLEALVRGVAGARRPGPDARDAARSSSSAPRRYLSVAELSAHLHLPLGVVRVLVGDLADEGFVASTPVSPSTAHRQPLPSLSVLESVLNGISAL